MEIRRTVLIHPQMLVTAFVVIVLVTELTQAQVKLDDTYWDELVVDRNYRC